MRALLILATTALLLGCGFKLQGEQWPNAWREYRLSYPQRDMAVQGFVDVLDETLKQRGLRPGMAGAGFVLELRSLRDQTLVAAIGADGKAAEFDLMRQVEFVLLTADWRSPLIQLAASRRMSFDPNLVLAKEAEEAHMRRALSRELAQRMLLRSEAELRRRDLAE